MCCFNRGYQQTQAVIITASPTSLAGKLGLSETDQLILETQQLSQVRQRVTSNRTAPVYLVISFQLLQIKCQQLQQILQNKMNRIEELTNSLNEKDTTIEDLTAKVKELSKK